MILRNSDGNTALALACDKCHVVVVLALEDKRVDMDSK